MFEAKTFFVVLLLSLLRSLFDEALLSDTLMISYQISFKKVVSDYTENYYDSLHL